VGSTPIQPKPPAAIIDKGDKIVTVKEIRENLKAHPPESAILFRDLEGNYYDLCAIEQTFAASSPQSNEDYTTFRIEQREE
jgi:hypothetical protein